MNVPGDDFQELHHELYKVLFETSDEATLIINPDHTIYLANHAAELLTGYSLAELRQLTTANLFGNRKRSQCTQHYDKIFSGDTVAFEGKIIRKSGNPVEIKSSCTLIHIGNRSFIQARIRDISKEKQIEEKFRLLFEHAQVGILRINMKTRKILEANESAATIFGYKSGGTLGRIRKVQRYFTNPNQLVRLYRQFVKKGFLKNIELPMRKKNDSRIWVSISCWYARYEHNVINVIILDLTDLHRSQEELNIKNEQLIQADKLAALGTLVAGVAHEINNPTSYITMNIPILKDAWEQALPILEEFQDSHGDFRLAGLDFSEMKQEIPSICADILTRAMSISKMVTDLKDFAREKPVNIWERVNINDVVKVALMLTNNTIKKSTKSFRLRYGEDIPLIMANSQRLQQVIINLIVNACQSLQKNTEEIFIKTEFDRASGRVIVTVKDDGRGISKDDLSRIFDPFFTTKERGTGLGLSISYGIVKDHSGDLIIESEINKGTEARIILPVKPDV